MDLTPRLRRLAALPLLSAACWFFAPANGSAEAPQAVAPAPAAPEAAPSLAQAYADVLTRHGLDPAALAARGFAFYQGSCYRLNASGVPQGPAMSPVDLDAALGDPAKQAAPVAAVKAGPAVPAALVQAGKADTKEALDALYNGKARKADAAPVVNAPGGGAATAPGWTEPDFDPALQPLAKSMLGKKSSAKALQSLTALFQADDTTPTGLAPNAGEAWRMLSLALYSGKGGIPARNELKREMVLVSGLTIEQKKVFASQLKSPLPVYFTLANSHSPHFAESQLYFAKMGSLLKQSGLSLDDYIKQTDPTERYAAPFLLRIQAYDALLPYLSKNPQQAAAVASYLFSDKRPDLIRSEASRIEGFAAPLASIRGAAPDAFVQRVLSIAQSAGPAAAPAALFLKMNEATFPSYRLRIENATASIPAAVLDDPKLAAPDPAAVWPQGSIKFVLYFPFQTSFSGWMHFYQSHGYSVVQNDANGVHMAKQIGDTTVTLVAKMFDGDEEGFLRGDEAQRFLKTVQADLRDPSIQGVITRTHAQFYYPALFKRGATQDKVWLDGSCRGSWYQEEYEKRCKDCAIVNNTATGEGEITNPALYEMLEGLARGEDWQAIYKRMKKPLPRNAARFMGPWTPPYWTALDVLKKYQKQNPQTPPSGGAAAR